MDDVDWQENVYMPISSNYRGDVKSKGAVKRLKKTNKKRTFVEWCPTGYKVGLNQRETLALDDDVGALPSTNVIMFGNNTDRVAKNSDLMYSHQQAFVHWYVGDAMEEGELAEARKDLEFLEKDYLNLLGEQSTDEESGGDSEIGQFDKYEQRMCCIVFKNIHCANSCKLITLVFFFFVCVVCCFGWFLF